MHPLARVVSELPEPKILVVGDLILDAYVEGYARNRANFDTRAPLSLWSRR